jgi:hypothetical protein
MHGESNIKKKLALHIHTEPNLTYKWIKVFTRNYDICVISEYNIMGSNKIFIAFLPLLHCRSTPVYPACCN